MAQQIDLTLMAQQFYIPLQGCENPMFEMSAAMLLDPEKALEAVQTGGTEIRAIGHGLGVSYAGLALHNLVVAACIFYAYNRKWLDMSLDNLTFQLESHGTYVQNAFKLNEMTETDIPENDGERLFGRKLETYIREQLTPAVRSVAESCGFKADLIWGQYGARFAYYIKHVAEKAPNDEIRERFAAATRILMDIAPENFARRRNPFVHKPRYIDSPYKPGETMMLRSACCMWYCKEDGVKCYNCPKLTGEEREARREAIMAKAQ